MTLLQTIKEKQLAARKSHCPDLASLLTTLIGEGEAIGKNDGNRETTDIEMVAVIKKFIKNNDIFLEALPSEQSTKREQLVSEQAVLNGLLPKQLTESELEVIIAAMVLTHGCNLGKIMGQLKTLYNGQYDGKLATTLIKKAIGQ